MLSLSRSTSALLRRSQQSRSLAGLGDRAPKPPRSLKKVTQVHVSGDGSVYFQATAHPAKTRVEISAKDINANNPLWQNQIPSLISQTKRS